MPGARLHSYRLGDRSELFVEQFLSAIAFTTPVPRQEDIGYDFFCSLISREGNLLKAGPFFAVQTKSTAAPIVYEKPHEIAFITSLENPLLVCVADRASMAVDVYSTWNVMCGPLAAGQQKITLAPGIPRDDWPGVIHNADKSQEIRLGPPIVRITSGELFDQDRMDAIATVINDWITLDRRNIVNRSAEMYWVQGPLEYTTGQRPEGAGGIAFYWHPDNVPGASRNLGRAATALELILRDHLPASERGKPEWTERETALREVLRTHWPLFDDGVRNFLRSQGFNFDAG
jgi:hypothetical protein